MDFHDAANIFPLDEQSIDALAADIRRNGLAVPIETMAGKILDGRRRWLACRKIGATPPMKEVSPDDPVAYVLSLNLHRRHLSPAQRSMVGARAREVYDRQAKERQKDAASKAGKASGASRRGETNVPENLPEPSKGDARDQVGKAIGVSGTSIDHATKVLKQGTPELVRAVDEGRMAVSTAALVSHESPEEQAKVVERQIGRGRRYLPGSGGIKDLSEQEEVEEAAPNGKQKGVGVIRAHEAINCLIRIPKNDALRKRGFQIVTDWIKANR